MTIQEAVKQRLTEYPIYRERANKSEFIARMLREEFGLDNMTLEKLTKMLPRVNSIDTAWRHVLQKNPHLQGSDYGNKEVLEQEKIIELGYEIGTRKLNI